jgi:flagellar hook-basal body complex protein FliE
MPGIEAISGVGVDALSLYRQLPQYAALDAASGADGVGSVPGAGGSDAFGAMVTEKLGAAVNLQHEGAAAAQALATGQADDISAATIAVQKANISLQLVGALRNKALEAYQDVMRMQV